MQKRIIFNSLFQKVGFYFVVIILIKFLFLNLCLAQEISSLLNLNTSYTILDKDDNIFRLQPAQTRLVIIDFKEGDILHNYRYYVKGVINDLKLQLMEYDFFTRLYLRNDIVSMRFLDILNERQIFQFHKKIYQYFHGFHNLKYPPEVDGIHKIYLEILDDAQGYLDFDARGDDSLFSNSTIPYRIMELYNAYINQKKLLEATSFLNNLLEANGIQPY